MSRATRRLFIVLAIVLVTGSVLNLAYHGPDWLGTILAVLAALTIISALDWVRARRLKARRTR
jgi:uncharacterized membrane protein